MVRNDSADASSRVPDPSPSFYGLDAPRWAYRCAPCCSVSLVSPPPSAFFDSRHLKSWSWMWRDSCGLFLIWSCGLHVVFSLLFKLSGHVVFSLLFKLSGHVVFSLLFKLSGHVVFMWSSCGLFLIWSCGFMWSSCGLFMWSFPFFHVDSCGLFLIWLFSCRVSILEVEQGGHERGGGC
jgi:hypothetical protein